MQIGSRNETFKTKSFSKKYHSVFVFAGSTLEANKGKSESKRKCYNIVLLTLEACVQFYKFREVVEF